MVLSLQVCRQLAEPRIWRKYQSPNLNTKEPIVWPGIQASGRNSAKNLGLVVGFDDVTLSTSVRPYQICQMRPRSKSVLWCPVIAARILE